MTLLLPIFLIALFLLLIAFFSASETAITAASKAKFHQLAKEGNTRALIITELQNQLGLVISVLLMCNTMLTSSVVALTTGLFINMFGQEGIAYASAFMGLLILVYGEVLPKMLTLIRPEGLLLASAPLLRFIFNIFRPLNKVINFLARKSLQIFGVSSKMIINPYASIEELRGIIDLHKGPGQDVPHERAMLKSILDLGSVYVKEIMIHRQHVTMVNADEPISRIVDQILHSPYTRLPLWQGHRENIVGVINAKALLRVVRNYPGEIDTLSIFDATLKPWFVPENTDLLEQLQAFRLRREHFAIVVDEYGAWMGIVTLEDILEEIVGEIDDEHDIGVRGVQRNDDGSYVISGNVTIRDLNREFEWNLPDEQAATLAGLLLHELRRIPELGQVFLLHGFRLEILRRHRNQVTLIKVTPLTLALPAPTHVH